AQVRQLRREVLFEFDTVGERYRLDLQAEVAGKALDHGTSHHIVRVELQTPGDRQVSRLEVSVVPLQVLHVLVVGGPDLADGGDAQAKHVAFGMRRISLEVALQPPLDLGDRKCIVRPRKMIHAYVHIAGARQSAYRERQYPELVV